MSSLQKQINKGLESHHEAHALSVRVESIFDLVEKHTGIHWTDMVGPSKKGHIVKARHLVAYLLCRHIKGPSLEQKGRIINRHYATMIHGSRSIENQAQFDQRFKKELQSIEDALTSSDIHLEAERKTTLSSFLMTKEQLQKIHNLGANGQTFLHSLILVLKS